MSLFSTRTRNKNCNFPGTMKTRHRSMNFDSRLTNWTIFNSSLWQMFQGAMLLHPPALKWFVAQDNDHFFFTQNLWLSHMEQNLCSHAILMASTRWQANLFVVHSMTTLQAVCTQKIEYLFSRFLCRKIHFCSYLIILKKDACLPQSSGNKVFIGKHKDQQNSVGWLEELDKFSGMQ